MTDATKGQPLTVTYFMKPGIGLGQLDALGQLGRELKWLHALCDLGLRINLISYSGRSEQDFAPRSPQIQLFCNSMGLPDRTYLRRLHQLHALPLLRSHVFHTMNIHAMRYALRAQWAWRAPVICRCNYLWSVSIEPTTKIRQSWLKEACDFEENIFSNTTRISTATDLLTQEVLRRVPSAASKITVIPNYVDCQLFQPLHSEKRYDLIYVGFLIHIKNLEATLEAVERNGASIAIIGGVRTDEKGDPVEPAVEARLKARFGDSERIHWLGKMPNEDLPAYINQAKALILCSHSEGHPRSMIEAMACGVPVIGSRVGGLAATLQHKVTGYLCETDVDSIAAAIKTVLSQPRLIDEMGANARKFALENNSLPKVAQREYDLLADVARRNPVESIPRRLADYVFRPRR